MRRRQNLLIAAIAVLALGLAMPAMAADRWFHVRIDEDRGDGEVSINVPVSLIKSFLPFVEQQLENEGDFDLDLGEFNNLNMLELFEALRDSPDAEFVTVRSRDGENVTVAKERGFLVARVVDGRDRVTVQMPMEVVEVLLEESDHRRINLVAAFEALARVGDVDLVRVESDDTLIRVWIDSSETGE